MDNGQLSLWISLASIVVAGSSAFFSWGQMRAAQAQLKRKEPVFEVHLQPAVRDDGWSDGWIYVRNTEQVGLRLISISVKKRAARLLHADYFFGRDGYGQSIVNEVLPLERATSKIILNYPVSAGNGPGLPSGGIRVDFGYKPPLGASDLKYDWKWADK